MGSTKIDKNRAIELFKKIINDECIKHDFSLKFINLSLNDRFLELCKEEKIDLKKKSNWIEAFNIYRYARNIVAYYDSKHNSVTFITDKQILFTDTEKYNRSDVLVTAYHEFFHVLDENRVDDFLENDCSLESIDFGYFFSIIEFIVWQYQAVNNRYQTEPQCFISEIQADLYGVANTFNHNLSIGDRNALKKYEQRLRYRYKNYDSDFFVDMFYIDYKKYFGLSNEYNKGIFNIFYKDGKYRDFEDIIHDPNLSRVDPRIVKAIFASSSFLENVYYSESNLSRDSLVYLFNILDSELRRLNAKIDDKKRFMADDSFSYYGKIFLKNIGKSYELLKKVPFLGEHIINPMFKNKTELKKAYAKKITDKDLSKIFLVKSVYEKLVEMLYAMEKNNKSK